MCLSFQELTQLTLPITTS